jgi:hypothetical protein
MLRSEQYASLGPCRHELRRALADAIRDRAWRCVEIIQAHIEEQERAASGNVVPITKRRPGG